MHTHTHTHLNTHTADLLLQGASTATPPAAAAAAAAATGTAAAPRPLPIASATDPTSDQPAQSQPQPHKRMCAYANDRAIDGTTALHIAAQRGRVGMVRLCACVRVCVRMCVRVCACVRHGCGERDSSCDLFHLTTTGAPSAAAIWGRPVAPQRPRTLPAGLCQVRVSARHINTHTLTHRG